MLRIRSLGECSIELGPSARLGPESTVLFAVLLYLAVERGKRVPRRTLTDLLWPGVPDSRARHCLRQTIYRLKHIGVPLAVAPDGIELPAQLVEADFDQLQGNHGAGVLGASGEFLPGYAPTFSEPFSDWVEQQRALVSSRLRRALLAAMLERRSRGDWTGVEMFARKCLQVDPLNQEATLGLAEATALAGGKTEALRILDAYREEVGPVAKDVALPAGVLRRRIAEHIVAPSAQRQEDSYFVGRADAMETLDALLRHARSNMGSGCFLWGGAGIGKTRLLKEFFKVVRLQGVHCIRVACQPTDSKRPLSAFVDLVPLLVVLPGAIGALPNSLSYLRRLTELDTATLAPSPEVHEAEILSFKIRQALLDLIDAVSGERALLLAIEDVHWLDDRSWEVLRALLGWITDRPVFIVLTSRGTVPSGRWASDVKVIAHELQGLDGYSARQLVQALTESTPYAQDAESQEWCVRVASGNPLHLLELVNHWMATGRAHTLPPSLTMLISERLERLPRTSLRLLQACAALHRNATFHRVDAILDFGKLELLEAMDQLEKEDLVTCVDSTLQSKHELVSDAALSMLSSSGQKLLHRHAAVLLERELEQSHASALLWDCASHWLAAGEQGRGITIARSYAKHLVDAGLPDGAAEVLRRAAELCTTSEQSLSILEDLSYALRLSARSSELVTVLHTMCRLRNQLKLSVSHHSDEELSELEAKRHLNWPSIELLARTRSCVREAQASPLHRMQAAALGLAFASNLFDREAAHSIFQETRKFAYLPDVTEGARLHVEIIFNTEYGDLDRAAEAARLMIQYERSHGTTLTIMRALRHGSSPLRRLGRFDEAHDLIAECVQLAVRYNLASSALVAATYMICLHLERGDWDSAAQWSSRSEQWRHGTADEEHLNNHRYFQALVHLRTGEAAAARAIYTPSLDEVLRAPTLRGRAERLAFLARVHMATSVLPQDGRLLRELEDIFLLSRSCGDRDLEAEALVVALHREGQQQRAIELWREYLGRHRQERYPHAADPGIAGHPPLDS